MGTPGRGAAEGSLRRRAAGAPCHSVGNWKPQHACAQRLVPTEVLPVLSEGHNVLEEGANYHSLHVPWFLLSRKPQPHPRSPAKLSLSNTDEGELRLGADLGGPGEEESPGVALPRQQGLCMSYLGLGLLGWGKEGQTRQGEGLAQGSSTDEESRGAQLGVCRESAWSAEQHGGMLRVSVSFRQRPRHGREGLVEGDGVIHVAR